MLISIEMKQISQSRLPTRNLKYYLKI